MVKSLTFTGEFGYITDKIKEPSCPVRGYDGKNTPSWIKFTDKEKEEIKKRKKDYKIAIAAGSIQRRYYYYCRNKHQ